MYDQFHSQLLSLFLAGLQPQQPMTPGSHLRTSATNMGNNGGGGGNLAGFMKPHRSTPETNVGQSGNGHLQQQSQQQSVATTASAVASSESSISSKAVAGNAPTTTAATVTEAGGGGPVSATAAKGPSSIASRGEDCHYNPTPIQRPQGTPSTYKIT